jgi:hypothetical protein
MYHTLCVSMVLGLNHNIIGITKISSRGDFCVIFLRSDVFFSLRKCLLKVFFLVNSIVTRKRYGYEKDKKICCGVCAR